MSLEHGRSVASPTVTPTVAVGREEAGLRLDVGMVLLYPPMSRNRAHQLVASGHVRVDGATIDRPSTRLRSGQHIDLDVPPLEPETMVPEALELEIVYADDDLAVINKPAGLVVHPAAGHARGTVANAALHHFGPLPTAGGLRRPGIVHRLDRDTSGLLVVAKSERAMADLLRQFQARTVRKAYLALVRGWPPASATIERPVGRDPRDRTRMSVTAGGRPATTRFQRLRQYERCALVRVRMETGRTHQIRVHMASVGHPVVGDQVYGGRGGGSAAGLSRQFLHAWQLVFQLPADARLLRCEACLPDDLRTALAAVGDEDPARWAPHTRYEMLPLLPDGLREPDARLIEDAQDDSEHEG